MKKLVPPAAVMLFASVAIAQTTWTGSVDTDFHNGSNWNNGLPNITDNPGTIESGATSVITNTFTAIVTQTGGTVSYAPAAARNFQSGSIWNLNGGTFDLANDQIFVINGGTFNVNAGGTLTSTSGTTSTLRLATGTSVFNVNTDVTMTNNQLNHRNGAVTIDASTLTVGQIVYALNGAVDPQLNLVNGASLIVTDSGSQAGLLQYGANVGTSYGNINFGSGVNSLTAADTTSRFNEFNFDFALDSIGSSISIGGTIVTSAMWESLWADGSLSVDGSSTGSLYDYFTVTTYDTTGTTLTLTAVPEPGTYALIGGILILGWVAIRRRK